MVLRPIQQSDDAKKALSNASHHHEIKPFETSESTVVFTGNVPSFWAILFMDDNGNIGESSNLQSAVFSDKVYENFRALTEAAGQRDQQSSQIAASPLRINPRACPRVSSRHKRRRGNLRAEVLTADCPEPIDEEMDLIPLTIGDTARVTAYYDSAFRRLQQLNCRMLAKGFIKLIEPRKQVRHPYNGGRGAAPGEKGDPEKTKPEWWPRDVMHKEPDHLRKELRVKLLVHIIQRLLPIGITADKLEEVACDSRRLIKPPEKLGILDELFRVRRLEERYERNEVDATAVIYVVDHEGAKGKETSSDNEDEPDEEAEEVKTPEETEETPHSDEVSPLDTSSGFQISPDLSFGNQDGQVNFQSTQPDIGSQGLVATTAPLSASTMTPPGNQFMNHSPFTSPTSQEQMQPMNHQIQPQMHAQNAFPGWSSGFSQDLFAPVDYAGVSRAQMAYPTYTICPTPPTHPVPSPHTLPDLDRPQVDMMVMGNLPFRTGSLSHPNVLPRSDGSGGPQM